METEEKNKKIRLSIESVSELKRLREILPTGEEIYEQEPTPSKEIRDFLYTLPSTGSQVSNSAGAPQATIWPVHEMMGRLSDSLVQAKCLIDILQNVGDKGLLRVDQSQKEYKPPTLNSSTTPSRWKQQRDIFKDCSNILTSAASDLRSSIDKSQHVFLAAEEIKKTWPIGKRGKIAGITRNIIYVDYSYRSVGSHLKESGEAELHRSDDKEKEDANGMKLLIPTSHQLKRQIKIKYSDKMGVSNVSKSFNLSAEKSKKFHQRLLNAQKNLFEIDLFEELAKQAKLRKSFGIVQVFGNTIKIEMGDSSEIEIELTADDGKKVEGDNEEGPLNWAIFAVEQAMKIALVNQYNERKVKKIQPTPEPKRVEEGTATSWSMVESILHFVSCQRIVKMIQKMMKDINYLGGKVHLKKTSSPNVHLIQIIIKKTGITIEVRGGVAYVMSPDLHRIRILEDDLQDYLIEEIAKVVCSKKK